MKILVTGAAGFIGFHLAKRLLEEGEVVCGLDNFNNYYPVELKEARNAILERHEDFQVRRIDISDKQSLQGVFDEFHPDVVVNLAAQVGVRHSIEDPDAYVEANVVGFLNVLECCRKASPKPVLLYASSSSVYGNSNEMPLREDMRVDNPISLYAASKKSNELMAHCYSHLYGFQTLGFRFFTVYGPWGRPDMGVWLFAKGIAEGKPIKVFNNGNMSRDFTYIDDVVDGLVRCMRKAKDLPQCSVYNIGNNKPEKLLDLVAAISKEMGVEKPRMELLPMQDGDVFATFASIDKLKNEVGYEPRTPIEVGVPKFCSWYKAWRSEHPKV